MTKRPSRARLAITIAAACSVAVGAVITGTPAYSEGHGSRDVVQHELDDLVRDTGFPAALATYQDSRGRSRDYTAGVGDLETGARGAARRPGPHRQQQQDVRRGRAAAAGRRGEGRPRRARRDVPARSGPRRRRGRHPDHRPAGPPAHQRRAQLHRGDEPGLLHDAAPLRRAARAAGPGADPAGHRAGVGLVVQQHQLRHRRPDRAEGHRPAAGRGGHQPGHRTAAPADTYVPDRGEEELRERHPRGYHASEPGGELRDITVLDPSWAWAAGDIVRPRATSTRSSSPCSAASCCRPRSWRRCRRPSRRHRSCTACGTGWPSSAPR